MGSAKAVTDATFDAEVLRSPKPVVVDFWAEWCVPCRKIDAVLDDLAASPELAGQVTFVKVDTDNNPDITRKYQVMSVPTITVFKNGEPVGSVTGARPKSELFRMIQSAV